MIARNAENGLARALDSVQGYVDQIVIVLAGESKDRTEAIARQYTDEVYDFEWCDSFSAARNFAHSFLTTDWQFWLDHDDEVIGAEKLRGLCEQAERNGIGCLHLRYDYRHDDQGRSTVVQTRERLLKASVGWQWKDRVHEYAAGLTPHQVGFADDVVIEHHSEEPNRERNLKLLHLMEREDPDNWRMLGALGDTYQSAGEWDKALEYNERFFNAVEHIDSKWTAATEMARTYLKLKDWPKAEEWCLTAISLTNAYSLPYLLLAHVAWFGYQDSETALRYLGDADAREEAPLVIYRQPNDYGLNRWDVAHRCLADQERWPEALALVARAIEYIGTPGGVQVINHPATASWGYFQWYYRERLNSEKSVRGAYDLVNHLFCRGDTLGAREILRNLPVSVRDDNRILALGREVEAATAHVFDEAKYKDFYEAHHSDTHGQGLYTAMNATEVEAYRMEPLLARLKARDAQTVLDVGCGAGAPAIWLAKHGIAVTGIDVNGNAVKEARRLAKKALRGNGKSALLCSFRQGTLETLGSEDLGRFDAVLMMELIEHIHPSKVPFYLSSAEDFLNPGGAVFVTDPAMLVGDIPGVGQNFPRDHVKEYTLNDHEAFLANYPGRRVKLPVNLHKVHDPHVPIPGFGNWFMEYESYTEAQWERMQPANWDKPVVIYVGPGLEDWDPTTPETKGLGGSETWAVQTARELRAMGYPVAVYAMANGRWDGVIYRHYSMFNPEAPFGGEPAWLCIVSRHVEMLDTRPNAEHVAFVAHDTDYGDKLSESRLEAVDAYCVLSDWHREHTLSVYRESGFYEALAGKLRVVSNGVDLSYFEGQEARVPHSFVWGSSPDRGLDRLLEWWPAIREMWPDASLRVCYGWDNIDALSAERPWLAPFKRRVLELAKQPGVELVGRLGQRELAREYMRAQFWLYPSRLPEELGGGPWHETFCIAALEAAAAGCRAIMPSCGALTERPGLHTAGEEMSLDEALVALRQQENWRPEHDLSEWTWRAATERLLSAVETKEAEYVLTPR